MWDYSDNQEVGSEAAILQRVRNSSLVKWSCAENLTGLSLAPKLWMHPQGCYGRGAFWRQGSGTVKSRGAARSENAGMSSAKYVRTVFAENPRFPTPGQSASG